uniref:Uncharacterized protein n=1 Tax=Anguilla anguilla TaxID=7936 RepID=A0A0E9V5W4_ANGAN
MRKGKHIHLFGDKSKGAFFLSKFLCVTFNQM